MDLNSPTPQNENISKVPSGATKINEIDYRIKSIIIDKPIFQ